MAGRTKSPRWSHGARMFETSALRSVLGTGFSEVREVAATGCLFISMNSNNMKLASENILCIVIIARSES